MRVTSRAKYISQPGGARGAVCRVSEVRAGDQFSVTVRGERDGAFFLGVVVSNGGGTAAIFDGVCVEAGHGSMPPAQTLSHLCLRPTKGR
jgi:hypothetical protein